MCISAKDVLLRNPPKGLTKLVYSQPSQLCLYRTVLYKMVVGSHVKGPSVSKVQPIPKKNIQYSKPTVNILSHKAKIQLQYCQKGLFKVGTLFTKKCTTRFIFTRSGATKFYIAVFSLENLFTDLPYFAPTCTSFYSVLDPDPDGSGLFRRSGL